MSFTLHLGVIDVPHIEPGSTTYTVGKALEQDYGLFSAFAEFYENSIEQAIGQDAVLALEKVLSGEHIPTDLNKIFGTSTSAIDTMFNRFLDAGAIEDMGKPGVPTKAALEGKRTRFKGKGASARGWVKGKRGITEAVYGPRRPSFVDSGILKNSFKSWVE